ncbi:MAG TPA: aminotransferase class I/II-fold pyridoxal phosphate-dependent enzyme, partial [Chthoniobacterales bacterium]|nr:aminotransferase class I/II-fold pyridoxal phosphate-dependent enzyme [Chthoniobacterales bacterium]
MAQAFHGGRLCEAAKEFGLSPGAFVDFSANTNVHAPTVSAAHWEEWRTGIARYPEADAHSIRRQLAEIYHVPAEQLLPAAGAIEALYLAARLFPTSKVAIVEPAFSDYQRAFVAAGCDAVRVTLPYEMWHQPISHWHHLLAPFDVIVLGNPNNPTGSLQRRAELLRVLEGDDAGSKTWIIDEAFIEFVADQESETLMPFLNEHPTLIVLRS